MAPLESNYSNQVSTLAEDTLAPGKVLNLSFTVQQGSVDLTWDAVSVSALVTDTFSGDGATTVFTLQYSDLATGSYSVTVDGAEQVETTDYSINVVDGTVTFNVAPATGSDNIEVSYHQNLTDLSGYHIYRKKSEVDSFVEVGEVASGVTSFSDTSMKDGASYIYAIAAFDDEAVPNEGEYSDDLAVKTIPSVPQNLASDVFDSKVVLTWNSVKDSGDAELNENLAGYNVYRSETDGSGYAVIGSVDDVTETYEDSTVTNGVTYYYVVTAFDDSL